MKVNGTKTSGERDMTTSGAETAQRRRKIKQLEDYRGIAPDKVLHDIREKGNLLRRSTAVHVNATCFGGGVVEILDSLVLLMNDLGIRTDWRTLHGTPNFFEVTKKFHNALQGNNLDFSDEELQTYTFINEKFAQYALLDHDFTVIHDPQPCALAHFVPHTAPWVWRCHIDLTKPSNSPGNS
jgi:trehalose synthase